MLYITSDHAGFELKQHLVHFLKQNNISCLDMGPDVLDVTDDYPDFVKKTVEEMLIAPDVNKAIVICKNGIGVCVAANRYKEVRCGLSWNTQHAKSGREDDNTNVLALPAGYIDHQMAEQIVEMWLSTNFSNEERHQRRLKKIASMPCNA